MTQLKVDETAFHLNSGYLLVCNISIPYNQFNTPNLAQKVYRFIEQEYRQSTPVLFEITGSYILRHVHTNDLRDWVGSFSPRRSYSLVEKQNLEQDIFIDTLTQFLNVDFFIRRASQIVTDSSWVVDSITTLIVNSQAILPRHSTTLTRRNILEVADGRSRRHVTFYLP